MLQLLLPWGSRPAAQGQGSSLVHWALEGMWLGRKAVEGRGREVASSSKDALTARACKHCGSQGGLLRSLLQAMLPLFLPFRRQGNFKKDKALRKERKAEKEARKQA